MGRVKKATAEEFIASSIIRFGRHSDYIQEKILVDCFAIKGNLQMAEGLRIYIKNNLEHLRQLKKINILDIGPAIGAISSLIAMQVLNEFGLLEKTHLYLMDVSEKVIDETQKCNFSYPTSILKPELKSKLFKKLKNSKAEITSAEKIPWKDDMFTIVLAGFVFRHLHDTIKAKAASEAMRVLTKDGFFGLTEAWFKNYQKDYVKLHKKDNIPLAYESTIPYEKMSELLPKLNIFYSYDKDCKENFYTFCGKKF